MKRFIILSLALCLALVGCKKDEGDGKDTFAKLKITSIEYGVDATSKEAVLADLKANEPFPVGSYFFIDPFSWNPWPGLTGAWKVYDAKGKTLSEKTFIGEDEETQLPEYLLELLPIEQHIFEQCAFQVGSERIVYYLFTLQKSGENAFFAFYEDLTETCKAKYPDAGVNAVVRAYVSDGWL